MAAINFDLKSKRTSVSKADEGMMLRKSSELRIMRFLFTVFSVIATVVFAPSISICELILTQLCRYTT